MATINLILVGFLVSFAFTTWSPVSGKLLVTPEDVVVVLGKTIQINCSTDDTYGVNWWHVPVGSTTNEDVFISRVVVLPYRPRFKVERNEDENRIDDYRYNLVITSIRREDAGKYTCIDRVGLGEQRHAQLVVLEHRPQCHSNIHQEGFVGDNDCGIPPGEIRCSCRLQYSGNNPPVMEWTNSAGQMILPQPPVNTSHTNIISSDLVGKPTLTMSWTSIVWRPKFLTYKNWTSPDVKVKSVMKNRSEVNVTHGESVVCRANSSETCTYRWTTQNGTIISEAANLTIVNAGTYFCDATCSLHHRKCLVRSMVAALKKTHEDDKTKATSTAVTVAAVVIGLILVPSLVALAVLFCYLHKRKRNKNYIPRCEELHLLNQLKTENRMVVGVTKLDKLMYVAHHGLNVINVYKTIAPSSKPNHQIMVDGLLEPCDMAACPLNRCLYITDSKNKCVWKLRLSDGEVTKWVENIDEPYTISVCSSGNVLLVRQPNRVVEYNAEGFVVKECRVYSNGPIIHDIQHAVENKQRNFIVSHGGKRYKVHAICELSKDGVLVRSFGSAPGGGSRQLNNPRHVAVDDQDRVYVVDASNDRVLQLDKMFQGVLKLRSSARSQPLRLAFNDGQILIGKYGAIDVFAICETKRPRSKLNGEYSAVPVSESNSEEHSQSSICRQVLQA